MFIILLGAPGAGKGTQAAPLAKELGVAHVASGDLFRENLRQGTEVGRLAQSYMERGLLVPDDITVRMVKERLEQPDAARGAVLDGFPRTLEQAQALQEVLAQDGRQIDQVIYIKVSEEELLRRLTGRWTCRLCQAVYHMQGNPPRVASRCDGCGGELYQRPDDTLETARHRLQVYFAQTAPLIDYYARAGLLVEVDGEGDVDRVQRALHAALKIDAYHH